DLATFCLAQERLARGCGSTALSVNMHLFGLGAFAERGGFSEEQGEMFFRPLAAGLLVGGGYTEPECGSNCGTPSTTAHKFESGYLVNGRKDFNSMAPIIGLFLISAVLEGAEDVTPQVGFFAVPRETPGLDIDDNWNAMGMRATASHDLRLKDVRVSDHQLL